MAKIHESIPRPMDVLSRPWRLAFVVGSIALLSLGTRLWHSGFLSVDKPLSEWIRDNHALDVVQRASLLGSATAGVALALALSVFTWRRCRPLALVYPATIVAGMAINALLKTAIGRPRPPDPITGTSLAAFPSGHVIQATLFLGLLPPIIYVLSQRRQLFWLATMAFGAGVVGVALARVQLGAHWPTDVVGGTLVGVSLLMVADLALRHRLARGHCAGCSLHPVAARDDAPVRIPAAERR
jgi:undecaprenyl-diphosphatase